MSDYGVSENALNIMRQPLMYPGMTDYSPPFQHYQGQATSNSFGGIGAIFGLFGVGSTAYVAFFLFKKYQARIAQRRLSKEILARQSSGNVVPVSSTPQVASSTPVPGALKVAVNQASADSINMNVPRSEATVPQLPQRPPVLLYQVSRGYNTPSISPFSLKLETFLRIAQIPYTVEIRAPVDTDQEQPLLKIGEAAIFNKFECIEVLSRAYDIDLCRKVSKSRRAAASMAESTLDTKMFWAVNLWRWIYDNGRSLPLIQADVPSQRAMARIKDSVMNSALHNGIGNKSQEDVMKEAADTLGHLVMALGRHKYFLGDTPGVVDAQAFAILSQLYWNMPGSNLEAAIRQHRALVDYLGRIKTEFWPDWEDQVRRAYRPIPEQNVPQQNAPQPTPEKSKPTPEDIANSNYLPADNRSSHREPSPYRQPQQQQVYQQQVLVQPPHQEYGPAYNNHPAAVSSQMINQQQQMQNCQQQPQAFPQQRQSAQRTRANSEHEWGNPSNVSMEHSQMSQILQQQQQQRQQTPQMQQAYQNKFKQVREHLDSVSKQLNAAYGPQYQHQYAAGVRPSSTSSAYQDGQEYAVYPVRTQNPFLQSSQPQVFGSPHERMERAAQVALTKLINNPSNSGVVYNQPGSYNQQYANEYQQQNEGQQGSWN